MEEKEPSEEPSEEIKEIKIKKKEKKPKQMITEDGKKIEIIEDDEPHQKL